MHLLQLECLLGNIAFLFFFHNLFFNFISLGAKFKAI